MKTVLKVALGLLLGGIIPVTADAAQYRGAMVHPTWTWVYSEADYTRELDMLKASGANTARTAIAWAHIEPSGKGPIVTEQVHRLDMFLASARERGISVVLSIVGSPCWAANRPDSVPCDQAWRYPPREMYDYADTAEWAIRRWQHHIVAFEVWNEPNYDPFFAGLPDYRDKARVYADMLKTTYPRLKAAAPQVTVLGGATSLVDVPFVRELYDNGAGDSFDALSVHPYIGPVDPDDGGLKAQLDELHAFLAARGDGEAIWATEFGWDAAQTGEQRQAEYVADGFRIMEGLGYMRAALVYSLRNTSLDDPLEDNFGLVGAGFTPKPAYAAFIAAMAPPPPTPAPVVQAPVLRLLENEPPRPRDPTLPVWPDEHWP